MAGCIPSVPTEYSQPSNLAARGTHFNGNGVYRTPNTPPTGTSTLKFPVAPGATFATVAVDFCSPAPSLPRNSKSIENDRASFARFSTVPTNSVRFAWRSKSVYEIRARSCLPP